MKNLSDMIGACHAAPEFTFASDIMKEATELKIQQHRKQAVAACGDVIQLFTNVLASGVNALRLLRTQEEAQKNMVQKMDRAFRYFAETGNPLPMYKLLGQQREASSFCRTCGIPCPDPTNDAWEIDAAWTPKDQPTKADQKKIDKCCGGGCKK